MHSESKCDIFLCRNLTLLASRYFLSHSLSTFILVCSLSLPHTHTHTDHIWVLSSQDVECLAIGTGILGSGGGGDPKIGRSMAM